MLELNKIYQGDCIEVMKAIPNNSVDMLLTDIPYNELHLNKAGTLREIHKGKADELTFEIQDFLEETFRVVSGSFYIFCGQEQLSEIRKFYREKGLTTRIMVWEKNNPSPLAGKYLWLSGIELCVFARKPKATFNEHCKNTVLKFPSGRSKVHPTEKPLKLFEHLINASTKPNDVVLDTCIGSGTTAIACINASRFFIGIEQEQEYVDIANKRIEEHTNALNV